MSPAVERALYAVCSLILPGTGQAAQRRWFSALAFLAAAVFVALICSAWAATSIYGILARTLLGMTVRLAAAADVALARGEPVMRWPLAVVFVMLWLPIFVGRAVLVRFFIVESFRIPSGSMAPTLEFGDHVIVNRLPGQTIQRGDVIVFRNPQKLSQDYVKRVIAIGGDVVDVRGSEILVNGVALVHVPDGEVCSIDEKLGRRWNTLGCASEIESIDGRSWRIAHIPGRPPVDVSYPHLQVPADAVYVLGDNRDNSLDSRHIGAIPSANIKGRARYVLLSFGPHGLRKRVGKPID